MANWGKKQIQLREKYFANVLYRARIHLLVVATPLRFGRKVLVRVAPLRCAIAKQTPVEDQVNVFRKTVDQSVDFRETGPAFEDHLILELGVGEESLQNPANPEILLDDDRAHSQSACRFAEQVAPIRGGSHGDPIHVAPPPAQSAESRRTPSRWRSWYRPGPLDATKRAAMFECSK